VNVTQIGGQDVVEVAFVALSEAETHRLRRFTVAR
jgi:hypothetical protein